MTFVPKWRFVLFTKHMIQDTVKIVSGQNVRHRGVVEVKVLNSWLLVKQLYFGQGK